MIFVKVTVFTLRKISYNRFFIQIFLAKIIEAASLDINDVCLNLEINAQQPIRSWYAPKNNSNK